jgi:leucyl aminopeptidase (aminopeptidase T)
MHPSWPAIAGRIVAGLVVQPGELIQVRGDPGSYKALLEILLAIERAGGTPLPEITPAGYLPRLWREAAPGLLASWDARRAQLLAQVDRVVTFERAGMDPAELPDDTPAARQAAAEWREAAARLVAIEDARLLPVLVVAAPSDAWARQLGLSLAALEAALLPALAVPSEQLRAASETVLAAARASSGSAALTIHSGDGHALRLDQGERPWLSDDGQIDAADKASGAVVSNLPAGSIYTTVREDSAQGSLAVPQAGPARQAVLHFQDGRIAAVTAAEGAAELEAWLDGHSGEPRRISHVGIGLNPALQAPLGWTLVDEHVPGNLFLALGENRYMGGQNASTLNVDYVVPGVTFLAGENALVEAGKIVV